MTWIVVALVVHSLFLHWRLNQVRDYAEGLAAATENFCKASTDYILRTPGARE